MYFHMEYYWLYFCCLVLGRRGVDGDTCGYSLATPGIGYDRWMTTSLPYPPLTLCCTVLPWTRKEKTPMKIWQQFIWNMING